MSLGTSPSISPVDESLEGANSGEPLLEVAVRLDGRPGERRQERVQRLLQRGHVRHQQVDQIFADFGQHSFMFVQQVLSEGKLRRAF